MDSNLRVSNDICFACQITEFTRNEFELCPDENGVLAPRLCRFICRVAMFIRKCFSGRQSEDRAKTKESSLVMASLNRLSSTKCSIENAVAIPSTLITF